MKVIVSSASVWLRRTLRALVGGTLLTLSTLTAVASDVPGSRDHPLLSRFAGARINDYSHSDFDEAFLPNQPIDDQSDTDQAQIKPESKAQLDAMAKLLNTSPSLKVYSVGHTDNQGQFAHNADLSQKRAEAVLQALISTYHIAPARLTAKGIASLSPVASNSDDAGRTQNRRVELVQQ